MSDLNNTEGEYTLTRGIASSLKLFFLGNFFWALPGVIPTMELFSDYTLGFYEWVAWVTTIVAIVLFFLSARKISKTLKEN
jgi:hypothetical protein